jgi:uncharacterized protein YutE (UPF0331/DUF86 family)
VVDRELVLRKLADLDLYVSQLTEFRGTAVEKYRADWKTQRIVERTMQMAIEACLDVANHLIADRKLRVPTTYAQTFSVLEQAGLLPSDIAVQMVQMVGLRNLLIHEYARLDAARVVRLLNERLDDFGVYREAILAVQ